VADHRVSDLDVGHRRADLLDPARVLVPRHIWQKCVVGILYRLPLALDDVDVRAAEPGGPDAYNHVERILYPGLVYLLDLEAVFGNALVVAVQPRSLHIEASFSSFCPTPRVLP
jgi:hypothetical protein